MALNDPWETVPNQGVKNCSVHLQACLEFDESEIRRTEEKENRSSRTYNFPCHSAVPLVSTTPFGFNSDSTEMVTSVNCR